MYLLNNRLYLFNHTQGTIEVFNPSFWSISETKIIYNFNSKWVEEIFVDQQLQEVFVYVLKRGVSFIYKLNVQNGETTYVCKLPRSFVKDV